MADTSANTSERSRGEILRSILSRRMLVCGLMGFSCGVPLLLTYGVLQAWMKAEGVDLSTIGLFTLVHLPYTIKFLWAPFFDRYTLPFLGRRRGWLLVSQLCLAVAIFTLGQARPQEAPWMLVAAALAVTFLSSSQDILVDAYRREDLADDEQGLGSSVYVGGYRLGILLSSGGGLILADHIPFQQVYAVMSACMLVGILTTLLSPEPQATVAPPKTLLKAVVEPFIEYLSRDRAVLILIFMLLYKVGDQMASAMAVPFFLDIGFSRTEIGAIYKLVGTWATIGGAFLGGVVILRIGNYRALWAFGILQMVSTAGFAALAAVGPSTWMLTAVILFENLSMGLGTAAFLGFMAALTNKRFTATQFALLSSLTAIPRSLASAPTGYLAEQVGWVSFFITCTVAALPGLLLLGLFSSEDTNAKTGNS